jgi:hypothetical protein
VTFELFAPGDVTCASTPVFASTVALSGATAQSVGFTQAAAGTYRWVATYNGDANNSSVRGNCGDATETRAVARAIPTIATQASGNIVVGSGSLSDQATVTGIVNPIGPQMVTFRLYGAADATCTGAPVFTSTVALSAATAQSASFTPVAAGRYRWVATYEGDTNNLSVSGACGDLTETATATAAPMSLPPTGTALDRVLALALSAVVVGALTVRVTRRNVVQPGAPRHPAKRSC